MRTSWTMDEWLEGRARRRRISDSVSPKECGRPTSREDADLRESFQGRRNLPFATLEELEKAASEAAKRLVKKAG